MPSQDWPTWTRTRRTKSRINPSVSTRRSPPATTTPPSETTTFPRPHLYNPSCPSRSQPSTSPLLPLTSHLPSLLRPPSLRTIDPPTTPTSLLPQPCPRSPPSPTAPPCPSLLPSPTRFETTPSRPKSSILSNTRREEERTFGERVGRSVRVLEVGRGRVGKRRRGCSGVERRTRI